MALWQRWALRLHSIVVHIFSASGHPVEATPPVVLYACCWVIGLCMSREQTFRSVQSLSSSVEKAEIRIH